MFDIQHLVSSRARGTSRRKGSSKRTSKAAMRRKAEKRNRAFKIATFVAVPLVGVVVAYPYLKAMTEVVKPNPVTGCFDIPNQNNTAALIDYSTTNLYSDSAQLRGLKKGFMDVYSLMDTNQRLNVFTTSKDKSTDVAAPSYSVCKPAKDAESYARLKERQPNIQEMDQARLTKKAEKAAENFSVAVDEIIADSQTGSIGEKWDAPLFNRFKGISGYYKNRGKKLDHLIIFSAGIQVSEDAFWCENQGDLPSWKNFKKRPLYKTVKPFGSFEGMKVTFLMPRVVERYDIGDWCTLDEIRSFWTSYFYDAGAREVVIQPLEYRPGGGSVSAIEIGLLIAALAKALKYRKKEDQA